MSVSNIERFSLYCANVMGYKAVYWSDSYDCLMMSGLPHTKLEGFERPYTDLNVMAEVVEKLLDDADKFYLAKFSSHTLDTVGIKQAFRDFIISTMPEDSEK